jgi:hypothetical protein
MNVESEMSPGIQLATSHGVDPIHGLCLNMMIDATDICKDTTEFVILVNS